MSLKNDEPLTNLLLLQLSSEGTWQGVTLVPLLPLLTAASAGRKARGLLLLGLPAPLLPLKTAEGKA